MVPLPTDAFLRKLDQQSGICKIELRGYIIAEARMNDPTSQTTDSTVPRELFDIIEENEESAASSEETTSTRISSEGNTSSEEDTSKIERQSMCMIDIIEDHNAVPKPNCEPRALIRTRSIKPATASGSVMRYFLCGLN